MLQLLHFISLDWASNPSLSEGLLIVLCTISVIFICVGLAAMSPLKDPYLALDAYIMEKLFSDKDTTIENATIEDKFQKINSRFYPSYEHH